MNSFEISAVILCSEIMKAMVTEVQVCLGETGVPSASDASRRSQE